MSCLIHIDPFSPSAESAKNFLLFLSFPGVNDSMDESSVRGDVTRTSKLCFLELAGVLTVDSEFSYYFLLIHASVICFQNSKCASHIFLGTSSLSHTLV